MSFPALCTLARCRVCDVLAMSQSRDALQRSMLEVLAVARACLPPNAGTILPDSVAQDVIANEDPVSVFKPSMLVDLEVEAVVGGVVRRARGVGVATPQLDVVYAALLVVQRELVAKLA